MFKKSRFVCCNSILTLAIALAACGGGDDDRAPGTLAVTIYGEEFAEEGIPADVFSDGWSIRFDKVLLSVGAVTAAVGEDEPDLEAADYRIWDLARPSRGDGFEIASAEVPGGAYDHIGFRVAPSADAAAGNASADDVELMIDGGYSLHVGGTAEKDGDSLSFAWGFAGATSYRECEGISVVDGGDHITTLTIHMDHLFYDDLFSAEPLVSFDLVAQADADSSGDVTMDELAAVSIATQERYQVGSTGIDNLRDFIDYQTSTVGHIDGEGHCGIAERE
jgi:hypothetical protein